MISHTTLVAFKLKLFKNGISAFISTLAFLQSSFAFENTAIPNGVEGFKSNIKPFFKEHCIRCHGPEKSKGKITLHTLDGDLSEGHEIERWEKILDMLKHSEMPPEDEKQPNDKQRQVVADWINRGIHAYVNKATSTITEPTTRRLTNIEYQNTMRDLLGFELDLIKNLPEDPVKPYAFNNSAKYMLMGMEQLDRYKENARRIMHSAIVDPKEPKIHKAKQQWKASDNNPTATRHDEIGGNRGSPGTGLSILSWPKTGEYRIRIEAAGIFPKGVTEIPLRLVMGYSLAVNSSTLQVEHVGTVALKNNLDNIKTYEFRGRIENHPYNTNRSRRGRKLPDSMTATPQNIYDDGRLNDGINKMKRPRIVVRSLEFEAPVFKAWPPKHHTDILFDSPLRESEPEQYIKEVLKRFITRAFRRPALPSEIDQYFEIYNIVSKDLTSIEEAMRETLAMVLISPDFLYHKEIKNNPVNNHYEIASKLSYFLWGSMPDEELFTCAKNKTLLDPMAIETQVKRLLKNKRSKSFVKNFTTQWLSISKMKQVAINKSVFPRFLHVITVGERRGLEVPYIPTIRDYMMEETVSFIAELIKRNASVLNIVDSDFAMLNQRLAAHYRIEGVEGHQLRPVNIKPENNIGGLLTQGSVLIGNSTGTAPHPIYRAVWLREAILGDEVKDPPADVPSLSDSVGKSADNAVTIKDLLVQHRQKESCADCHVRLDPWGVPFERYNAIGQYQPMIPKEGVKVRGMKRGNAKEESFKEYFSYLKSINTEKVEADARVPHGPKVDGLKDLKKHLLKNRKHDIAINMIRRLLTYSIGRELNYRDRYTVEKLLETCKENQYQFQDMIIAICQNKTFLGKE